MATTTYEPIETFTLGSSVSTVTFGAGGTIPQTYTDLVLQITPKTSDGSGYYQIFPNNDTSSLYSRTLLQGNGSSASSNRNSNSSNGLQMNCATNSQDVNSYPTMVHFMNYTNTNTNKTMLVRAGSTSVGLVEAYVWLYRSTSAITSLVIKANTTTFAAGSTFTLYGIANAAIGAPKAQGGIITYDNTYYYHTFGSSGTFTPQQSLTNVDYLVIAGGASGSGGGGGGGAGGLRSTVDVTGGNGTLESKISLTSGTAYTVTVGAGGAAATTSYQIGNAGANSSIAGTGLTTITATGGGGGGGAEDIKDNRNGQAGGSGGGGGYNATTGQGAGGTRTASPIQGYNGGSVINTRGSGSASYSAGGGGAGAVAIDITTSSSVSSAGGNGVAIPSIANVTGTGVSTYYAGGGGGGTAGTGSQIALGGLGGGGRGYTTAGENGVVNTGSGGGGTGGQNGTNLSGAGGSGLVVIRYAKA
jgi:hypothetical protein